VGFQVDVERQFLNRGYKRCRWRVAHISTADPEFSFRTNTLGAPFLAVFEKWDGQRCRRRLKPRLLQQIQEEI
jgi:hypothetical protein